MPELRDRLAAALGSAYRVEKELGGGGMSRVFLAEETRLGRRVVVKVLPPEMAAGVSIERFEREIQLAAKLQHPHVVPLLTAGSSDDLLYYIMPHIEGESLRAKLAREGELPVAEALRVLRDVLDALAYAHSHHVVHRDIKPDNVLLSGKHALVTDFGVAKAVAESTGKTALTSMGVALGTPAYMAPEQATADPHTDHRADLYAVGALAYEMLSGRPPFTGMNAQAVLAAHLTESPEPVTRHRAAVPEGVSQLILRCLEKKPADRPQSADELLSQVEAMATPSGGMTPTGTQPIQAVGAADVMGAVRAFAQAHPLGVASLFTASSLVVLLVVYLVVQVVGLPDWVFYGAIGLLVIGLPIMLLTGHHERRRALARSSGHMTATPAGGLTPLFTWRKALMGGVLAFAGLGVVAAGYMAMRVLGIGPVGTLVASGVLGERERIFVADFENATPDSTLGRTVTDLLRIALAQSAVVTVLEPSQVADVLERMRRERSSRLTLELATEVAAREGIRAYVTGDLRPVGTGYLITARLVAPGTGAALVAVTEQATPEDLIRTVQRVSGKIRARIGESLRTVRAEPPLERFTTNSLEALQLYAQAEELSNGGDARGAIRLLEEAVKRDTLFAMAYRRMGAIMNARFPGEMNARGDSALLRAYQLRDRLSERERYHVEGIYWGWAANDTEKAIVPYLALLKKHPDDAIALNNIAAMYSRQGRLAEAADMSFRAVAVGGGTVPHRNLLFWLSLQGRMQEADSILGVYGERYPESSDVIVATSDVGAARRDFDGAARAAQQLMGAAPDARAEGLHRLAEVAQVRGRLAEAGRRHAEAWRVLSESGNLSGEERDLLARLDRVERSAWFGSDPRSLAGDVDNLWRRNLRLTEDRAVLGRRYPQFIVLFVQVGQPAVARRLLEEFRSAMDPGLRADFVRRAQLDALEGEILLGEGHVEEAVSRLRAIRQEWEDRCAACGLRLLGQAHERAGGLDSAAIYFERYANVLGAFIGEDEAWLAPVLHRLGELHEAAGDRRKALEYYGRFVDQWKDADPDLQPMVTEARRRMGRLAGEGR